MLIDIAMPGMNGWTLAERLRREKGLAAPIVMVSAHAAEQHASLIQSQDLPGHHDDFLAKPIDIEMLFTRIERLLKLDWVLDQVPQPPAAVSAALAGRPTSRALVESLSIGHVRGVERALANIETTAPAASVFLAEARRRLERTRSCRHRADDRGGAR